MIHALASFIFLLLAYKDGITSGGTKWILLGKYSFLFTHLLTNLALASLPNLYWKTIATLPYIITIWSNLGSSYSWLGNFFMAYGLIFFILPIIICQIFAQKLLFEDNFDFEWISGSISIFFTISLAWILFYHLVIVDSIYNRQESIVALSLLLISILLLICGVFKKKLRIKNDFARCLYISSIIAIIFAWIIVCEFTIITPFLLFETIICILLVCFVYWLNMKIKLRKIHAK